jgi:major vault protein
MPNVNEQLVEELRAEVIKPGQALKVCAKRAFVDATGVSRKAAEEWLLRTEGAYMPEVQVQVLGHVEPYIITDSHALHMRALRTFTDIFNKGASLSHQPP